MSSFYRYALLITLLFGLSSWGEKAHRKVNSSCVDFFPKEMRSLKFWAPTLADHSSDPDRRRKTDKTEYVKHFIDLDNYPDFIETKQIPESFREAVSIHGINFVKNNGTLPWCTDSVYKALVADFARKDWDQAVLTAAFLGHYVADGHMPLHCTGNYDGQLSEQKGIHSRYEETMIDRNIDKINFSVTKIKRVKNPEAYIFNYLYTNHRYVDSLLLADKKAFDHSGRIYNDMYYEQLWTKTGSFTEKLLENASKRLAVLIYSAWIQAGKPKPGKKQ